MSQFKNIVTKEINGNMRVCNLVTLLGSEVVKYMKITFIGNEHALEYGIGNIWIEAYDFDHMTKRLRPTITFTSEAGDELYDIFVSFIKDLNGKCVDNADMDYDSSFILESGSVSEHNAGIVFKYKHGEEVADEDKAKIVVDYQYLDEEVYNALLNLYCDLESIAVNNKEKESVIA